MKATLFITCVFFLEMSSVDSPKQAMFDVSQSNLYAFPC